MVTLCNRSLFYDRLRQKLSLALRKNEEFGIISLDMDGLKEINDNYGHRAGDAAIKEIAFRIKSLVGELDTVSGLGGDEFEIIVGNVVDRNDIKLLTKRIDCEIIKPFGFENFKINLRASIGYAHFKEDGIEMEVLIEKADKSMYEAKRECKEL
ncbi:diguanylate cyclase [Clostridium nigeriense]|uniref:diguanylate cyclase n=1 Tax=Clostridium nigeriense TaxID=1805470 RepID=UPI003D3575E4